MEPSLAFIIYYIYRPQTNPVVLLNSDKVIFGGIGTDQC